MNRLFMKLADLFLGELEQETIGTRRVLERVPAGRNDWKPHEKSMPLGYLASLVAFMPGWIDFMVNRDELDLQAPGNAKFKPGEWSATGDLIRMLDDSVATARAALANATDEHLLLPWRFSMGGRAVSEQPRYVMIRDTMFNHWAHHRGQSTVYLRLNDAVVPAIYGPSADEKGF
jgi:uncharacterized damage-inducible protein DinB